MNDSLFVWWLGQPAQPVLVGRLSLVRAGQGVSLSYAPGWLAHGFALSEDLPLREGEFLPAEKNMAVGAIDDARPDRWGERVIRFIDKPPRLSLMEHLFFAGDERFGALGVSTSDTEYLPRRFGLLPQLAEVRGVAALVQQVLQGEPVDEAQYRLVAPGATLGGARPKALLLLEGHPWVLKFSEPGEGVDLPLVEHAAMTLAARAGIRVAPTRALPLGRGKGHAVAVRRFDRDGVRRVHALSAHVALRAAGHTV